MMPNKYQNIGICMNFCAFWLHFPIITIFEYLNKKKQAEAKVVPSSSSVKVWVEVEDDVEVEVEVEAELGNYFQCKCELTGLK